MRRGRGFLRSASQMTLPGLCEMGVRRPTPSRLGGGQKGALWRPRGGIFEITLFPTSESNRWENRGPERALHLTVQVRTLSPCRA